MITTLTILIPFILAIIVALVPKENAKAANLLGILGGLATLVLGGLMVADLDTKSHLFQKEQFVAWVEPLGIGYHVGVDGLAAWLIVLNGLLGTVAAFYGASTIKSGHKLFSGSLLTLIGAMTGAFASLDIVLFFAFFELTLVPMWALIHTFGGPGRAKAAVKFIAFTFAGSVFLLVGMIALAYLAHKTNGAWTFDLVNLQSIVAKTNFWAEHAAAQTWIFWFFAIAFLVKAPSFPFHGWISDTYAESPIVGPILSSVMVKLGGFGILRFCLPLFPDAIRSQSALLMWLAAVGIVYGAVVACGQRDMRRMMAFSTVSHMGFVLLGIFSLTTNGMVGGALQQISHGVSAGLLFLLVGYLIERRGSARLDDFGGLKAVVPVLATLFMLGMLASVGLPGLNGFVGEFMALLGAFQAGFGHQNGADVGIAAVGGVGVILAAVYLLKLYKDVFYGESSEANASMSDVKRSEIGPAVVLVALALVGGIAPTIFTKGIEAPIEAARAMATSAPENRPTWLSPDEEQRRFKRTRTPIQARAEVKHVDL